MNPDKWSEIKRVFNEAVELPFEKRREFLSAACRNDGEISAGVEKLLASDVEAETLSGVFGNLDAISPLINNRIGNYRILRELGRGGMGAF